MASRRGQLEGGLASLVREPAENAERLLPRHAPEARPYERMVREDEPGAGVPPFHSIATTPGRTRERVAADNGRTGRASLQVNIGNDAVGTRVLVWGMSYIGYKVGMAILAG